MRTAVVGQSGTKFHNIRAKCCPRKTRAGQTIFWAMTAGPGTVARPHASWTERVFILHASCMAEMIDKAPVTAPTRPAEIAAELAALRAASAA